MERAFTRQSKNLPGQLEIAERLQNAHRTVITQAFAALTLLLSLQDGESAARLRQHHLLQTGK